MLAEAAEGRDDSAGRRAGTEQVAESVVAGLAEERFLILPHAEVGQYLRRKADDYDRWLRGMRRMQAKVDTKSATESMVTDEGQAAAVRRPRQTRLSFSPTSLASTRTYYR